MSAIPKIEDAKLEAVCAILGDTDAGLTGSEIGRLLSRCGIEDPNPSLTKRHRLFEALHARQAKDGCANNVFAFVQTAMDPVRFRGNNVGYEELRGRLNEALSFGGLNIGEDGKLRLVPKAETLTEAQARAGRLRQQLIQRRVHPDVLRFCRAELLQENHFHAVFEATKSVAQKIRDLTGLTNDGAESGCWRAGRGPFRCNGAQDEFTLAAIAQNLCRLARLVARPPPLGAMCVA